MTRVLETYLLSKLRVQNTHFLSFCFCNLFFSFTVGLHFYYPSCSPFTFLTFYPCCVFLFSFIIQIAFFFPLFFLFLLFFSSNFLCFAFFLPSFSPNKYACMPTQPSFPCSSHWKINWAFQQNPAGGMVGLIFWVLVFFFSLLLSVCALHASESGCP